MREPLQKWKLLLSWGQGSEVGWAQATPRHETPETLPHPQGACTCKDTCQGHEPSTAFSPLTILWLKLSTGLMAGTPQPDHWAGEDLLPTSQHTSPLLLLGAPRLCPPQRGPNQEGSSLPLLTLSTSGPL